MTSYYDWSGAEQAWKDAAIFPVIPESALRATLGILARTVAPGKPRPAPQPDDGIPGSRLACGQHRMIIKGLLGRPACGDDQECAQDATLYMAPAG